MRGEDVCLDIDTVVILNVYIKGKSFPKGDKVWNMNEIKVPIYNRNTSQGMLSIPI